MLSLFHLLFAAFVAESAVRASTGAEGLSGTTPTVQKRSYQSGGSTCHCELPLLLHVRGADGADVCPSKANNGDPLQVQRDAQDYDGRYVKFCG